MIYLISAVLLTSNIIIRVCNLVLKTFNCLVCLPSLVFWTSNSFVCIRNIYYQHSVTVSCWVCLYNRDLVTSHCFVCLRSWVFSNSNSFVCLPIMFWWHLFAWIVYADKCLWYNISSFFFAVPSLVAGHRINLSENFRYVRIHPISDSINMLISTYKCRNYILNLSHRIPLHCVHCIILYCITYHTKY